MQLAGTEYAAAARLVSGVLATPPLQDISGKKLKIWQNTSCQLPVYSSMFILSYAISQTSNKAKAIRVNTKQFNTFTEDRRFENKEMIQSSIFAADVSKLWSW